MSAGSLGDGHWNWTELEENKSHKSSSQNLGLAGPSPGERGSEISVSKQLPGRGLGEAVCSGRITSFITITPGDTGKSLGA